MLTPREDGTTLGAKIRIMEKAAEDSIRRPLKKSRFTEEQIISTIEQVEAGVPIAELCCKYGITQQTGA